MSFYYRCYGLNIRAEFRIKHLQANDSNSSIDIDITCGAVRKNLFNAKKLGFGLQISDNEILLTVCGIASYYIRNRNQIIVDHNNLSDTESVENFLINAALPYLLWHRKITLLHGAAFTMNGKNANLILGDFGVGKSTLLAGLCQSGAKVLSDEYIVLDKEKEISAVSGFPSIKLWQDTVEELSIDMARLVKIRPNIQRYYWDVADYFYEKPLPIQKIFILKREKNATKNKQLHDEKNIASLDNFLFFHSLLSPLEAQHSKILIELLSQCEVIFFSHMMKFPVTHDVERMVRALI